MANISKFSSQFQNKKVWIITTLLSGIVFYMACKNSGTKEDVKLSEAASSISFSSTVPTDINNPADPQQAAEFAWKEFIALTWPAKINASPAPGNSGYYRGQPSETDSSGSTGSGGVVVWETFYHRDELYPSYTTGGNILPNPDTIPSYLYQTPITKATPATNLNLFNNLDEASEITLAYMYYTPLAEKADAIRASFPQPNAAQKQQITDAGVNAALMYEAKANPAIYNYVKSNSYNNAAPRRKARSQSVNLINNDSVTGPTFTLPNGSIEMKATWRHYDPSTDDLNSFHWTVGIYYTSSASGLIANNDTLLLVGLHIIQKTPNVPTFTFATFEHVSNEKNGFRFINTNPLTDTSVKSAGRPLPDSGIITAIRQFPIPDSTSGFNLAGYNRSVQNQLRALFGKDVVWANYQLIGVQAVVQNDPGGPVPPQQFFLSNFATETNDALQFFQGGLGGPNGNVPNPNVAHVYKLDAATNKYITYTAGGCLGCHGSQGQNPGGDFSVIAATGNSFSPEAVTPYPGGKVVNQNPTGFPIPH